jgi:alkylation response protein AidB-like acyl-CoA dehydrogenase
MSTSLLGGAVEEALRGLALDLPLPGSGRTWERWVALAEISARDLSLGRLAEGHTDAVAVLAELSGPSPAGLWGVWAAEPPSARVVASRTDGGWALSGTKAWCSGASFLDYALITAHADDGRRLFAISTPPLRLVPGSWQAIGMRDSGSVTVELTGVAAVAVGEPGAYLSRPGFWHGGAGVAACWYGGALGLARTLLQAVREGHDDPHALAHLGAVDAQLSAMRATLSLAAQEIDADPLGPGALRAQRVRAVVEAGCTEVLDRVGRALGAGPLCLDAEHAQRAADLPVYLRQSHAERDLAGLGALAAVEAQW